MSKPLPKEITAHDLLKAAAVIIMIIDHVGFYFFPDNQWWRVIGRTGFPIWFYLVGYARARDIPKELWIGGAIVAASRMAFGFFFFPLNALFTIIICRLLIDGLMARALKSYDSLLGMFLIMIFLVFPSAVFFEYGSLAIMFAMFGYLVRNKKETGINPFILAVFGLASGLVFIFVQIVSMPAMTAAQVFWMLAGTEAMCLLLLFFRPGFYPRLTRILGPLSSLIMLMGRRTLEIYVIHLVIIGGLATWLQPDRFPLFGFQWFVPGLMRFFLPGAA